MEYAGLETVPIEARDGGRDGGVWRSINPTSGELLAEYRTATDGELEEIIRQAHEAFTAWRRTSFAVRAEALREAGRILRQRSNEYSELMTLEMGKPLAASVGEVEKCASVCDYYAANGEGQLASQPVALPGSDVQAMVVFEPLGIVLGIMPWNFPFWQVFRFAAPSLMAGNAVLLKHAPNTPGCALAIEEVFRDAGFPPALFRSALVDLEATGSMIDHDLVRAVTLTGSVRAGRAVAARAGAAIKKTVLELGGSDPYVILEDAHLEQAVEACVTSRLTNSGQTCIAAKRFVVVASVRAEFERLCVERMARATMGDPMQNGTQVGPQARGDLREVLHDQVRRSIALGARCLLGGYVPEGPGFFYPPTVLTDVVPGMPAFDDELFGPVAAIVEAADEAEAIRVANDTRFGLGAAVFTADRTRGREIAMHALEAGSCFVNAFVRSDPRLPFGGIRDSGYGRELSGYGIREFVNVKTVWVA